ncbi:MAG: glutamine synthetase [Chlamydiae bacterium CG10_big_fil_rev_8_21_14_0_10_42_34]|nr:MAG: glutamine synthetase [Chlamydiae bacterium CG10_big_fil_rev_8_21_14_0_10_42_34]
MNARSDAIRKIGKSGKISSHSNPQNRAHQFGQNVFHRGLIEKLPKKAAKNWLDVLDGVGKLDLDNADVIAESLKNWAIEHGATHFTHWFQPLTNASAEKHDAFLSWSTHGMVLEKFKGKELLRGEPDASSFPSGGLRATHEARGYTAWDPTSFPFLWEGGDGCTLCIPALFFSWKGSALDHKIPLLRSEEKLNHVVLKLLDLCGQKAKRVYSTLGAEQEYFAIDRSLFLLRPDLLLSGRTVYGAKPAKGQELEDHYFGAVKNRVMAYMQEFEDAAIKLGIAVKTRHNEVAPAQHEVAPLFERASLAADHNILLMELMRNCASKHNLACLLHEKPFKGLNGSGKHNNWSISTDTGQNLLDPEENSLVFLILLTAILRAVHQHSALLRASIASAGNDHRLGGAEAPPTILSVYLGDALNHIVEGIVHGKTGELKLRAVDLGLSSWPRHEVDASDRNRTSFFAFTGNKFEFRAVGSTAHCALPISTINAIVADSLQILLDEIASEVKDQQLSGEALFAKALPVLKKALKGAEPVLFSGDNYSEQWEQEAEARGLPNIRRSFHSFDQFIDKKAIRVFEGILSEEELHSRFEVMVEQYAKSINIEANLMVELFQTQILPTAQKDFSERGIAKQYSSLIDEAVEKTEEIKKMQSQLSDMGWEAKAKVFCELISPKMEELRTLVDQLELIVDDALWPLPKYRELLFVI